MVTGAVIPASDVEVSPSQFISPDDVQVDSQSQEGPFVSPIANFDYQALKGAGSEALNLGKGLLTSIPGVSELSSLPAEYRAYESARSQGKSLTDSLDAARQAQAQRSDLIGTVESRLKEFKTNPGSARGKALVDSAPMLLTLGDSAGASAEGATEGASEATTATPESATPESVDDSESAPPDEPGIVQQIIQGDKVAQAPAQAAVRKVAGAESDAPILAGNETVLDEPLADLKARESAAYKQMDDTVGFDLKAEKAQLSVDKYRLAQLGNTDADAATRGDLIEAINDSTDRITDAESKLQEAGIDPKAADTLHQQRMAGNDFKKVLVRSTNPDGTINVDQLLKGSKNLRFDKRGDRLSQFMGDDGADSFMSDLQHAQKLGANAIRRRNRNDDRKVRGPSQPLSRRLALP